MKRLRRWVRAKLGLRPLTCEPNVIVGYATHSEVELWMCGDAVCRCGGVGYTRPMTNKQKAAAVIGIAALTFLLCIGAATAVKCVNAGGHWHVLWCTQDK